MSDYTYIPYFFISTLWIFILTIIPVFQPQFVILAAGVGSRLGMSYPKSLTILDNSETIMARQIRNIHAAFGSNVDITIVVGFMLDSIIAAFPDEKFVYNDVYDRTNTSKSLLLALKHLDKKNNVVWMNGDVVFDEDLLFYFRNQIDSKNASIITVSTASVADEEVKYTIDSNGYINALSKIIPIDLALGESIGINYVSAADRPSLERNLATVNDNDYFERGIELSISRDGHKYSPFDITTLGISAIEVDFVEDLVKANAAIKI